ncbi:hypothetical protein (plasmid) [Citrobacter freundii]|uniref:Uncharacterized protein n=2 Tax=Enterobacteriaceae TaxID=543 RepID=A0A218N1A1_ECOLX|nr:hypothetical protein KP13_03944 [Klebsiella pneumoniae subsp. pneumoniae Kp13]ASF79948.1 hypothetical protein [Escherichia coli]ASF80556.1 hypothetical protein [Klebsiella pneumoniae]AVE24299.1 hypothetical protein [Citrobacter freundii]ASF80741.1 hypothetical protein [Escherichia coli]
MYANWNLSRYVTDSSGSGMDNESTEISEKKRCVIPEPALQLMSLIHSDNTRLTC